MSSSDEIIALRKLVEAQTRHILELKEIVDRRFNIEIENKFSQGRIIRYRDISGRVSGRAGTFEKTNLRLTINFVTSKESKILSDTLRTTSDKIEVQKPFFTSKVPELPIILDKLRTEEDEIIAWLQKSPENLQAFFQDPINNLLLIGVKLTRTQIKQIIAVRRQAEKNDTIPSNIEIRDIHLSVAHSKSTE